VSPGKTVYLIYRHPHSLAQSCYIMSLEWNSKDRITGRDCKQGQDSRTEQ
jgi:hypothetical protein